MMNPAVTELRLIADHIKRVGLYQGGNNYDSTSSLPKEERPCCFYGAKYVVFPDGEGWRAVEELRDVVGTFIAEWSDHTPQDEMLATLRSLADKLERGEKR